MNEYIVKINQLIEKLRASIPEDANGSEIEDIDKLITNIQTQVKDQNNAFPNPLAKSKYIKDLRSILLIFRKAILPTIVRAEVNKLRFLNDAANAINNANSDDIQYELKQIGFIGKNQIDQMQALATLVSNLAKAD